MDNVKLVPGGFAGHVVPDPAFGEVALDPSFTGAASRGVEAPYFSQLENLGDMVAIYTPYAPPPVRDRVVYVLVSAVPAFAQAPLALRADAGVVADTAAGLSLAELTEDMRSLVDLPVQDLARMCGIGRRQYYNLLRRKAETMKTAEGERRLRLVHHCLRDLHDRLGTDAAVRAAVLMPLAARNNRTLFDIVTDDGLPSVHEAYASLLEQLSAGAEPSPDVLSPSGTFPEGDTRWTEAASFVRNYRPVDG